MMNSKVIAVNFLVDFDNQKVNASIKTIRKETALAERLVVCEVMLGTARE